METTQQQTGLKSFQELYEVDLSNHTRKKPTFYKDKQTGKLKYTDESKWLDYIEWATVITLLYQHGAKKVRFGSYKNENGYPAFYKDGKRPFVRVWVSIDGETFEMDFPVIDGNRADEDPNQLTIHKAQQRGMVKCVAINTGLGLKLWQNEEHKFDKMQPEEEKEGPSKIELKRAEVREALDAYQGQDRETIRKECLDVWQKKTETIDFYNKKLKQMGYEQS
jgi:hypothetical protein